MDRYVYKLSNKFNIISILLLFSYNPTFPNHSQHILSSLPTHRNLSQQIKQLRTTVSRDVDAGAVKNKKFSNPYIAFLPYHYRRYTNSNIKPTTMHINRKKIVAHIFFSLVSCGCLSAQTLPDLTTKK